MSSFAWTLPASSAPSPGTSVPDARRQLFGKDLDWRRGSLAATGAGDWLTVEGLEALRQWVLRCLQTPLNGWPTRPGYGVGVEDFVEEEMTASKFAELVNRIRTALPRDPRIDAVAAVQVADDGEVFILRVSIKAKGQTITLGDFRFNEVIV